MENQIIIGLLAILLVAIFVIFKLINKVSRLEVSNNTLNEELESEQLNSKSLQRRIQTLEGSSKTDFESIKLKDESITNLRTELLKANTKAKEWEDKFNTVSGTTAIEGKSQIKDDRESVKPTVKRRPSKK